MPATDLSTNIPDDFVVDIHDLAAIILDAHAQTEPIFAHSQLREVYRGDGTLATFSEHFLDPLWHSLAFDPTQKRVAYILENDTTSERVTLDTFASPKGVKTPGGRELTRRELEVVYWRCKDYDNGYVLSHVAQQVFDRLPPTATLRARTSTKHEILCRPSDVAVGEIDIRPKEACLIVTIEPRPESGPSAVNMQQHLSGFTDSTSWVFLVIGKAQSINMDADSRVVLDLTLPQIGGRGGGGELFALERTIVYHHQVLARVADEFEGYKLSGKLNPSPEHSHRRQRADALVELVMARLARVAAGDDHFCRYCGKDGVETRCSKCKKAYFCPPCQALGWKYHKVWCS
ncbi:hypothetical protein PYCCODRAFT_1431850 [Trametes coccinea BRFM310]|uniref:MYND-type domain-containing protein n=1 Tax=Trametes coccinea (strain BRFM310) TaxID=1353009 RepID=A0A1Y2J1E4_TRAC3|nr:hypothetical protein PYCCODRAFT_1431850 [Trametes coccinea BRFM310]